MSEKRRTFLDGFYALSSSSTDLRALAAGFKRGSRRGIKTISDAFLWVDIIAGMSTTGLRFDDLMAGFDDAEQERVVVALNFFIASATLSCLRAACKYSAARDQWRVVNIPGTWFTSADGAEHIVVVLAEAAGVPVETIWGESRRRSGPKQIPV